MSKIIYPIEKAFQDYIEKPNNVKGLTLAKCLSELGMNEESEALNFFLKNGDLASFRFNGGVWDEFICTVGRVPPLNSCEGDLWFDVVELSLAIYMVNADTQIPVWISVRPVMMWQFRSFIKLARLSIKKKSFLKKNNLFSPERFKFIPSHEIATLLYEEEAEVYSLWFQKVLLPETDLKYVQPRLSKEQFLSLLPIGYRIWDAERPDEDPEFLRLAIGHYFTDDKQTIEFTNYVLKEWDKDENIGLVTAAYPESEMNQSKIGLETEFVKFWNYSPRHKFILR